MYENKIEVKDKFCYFYNGYRKTNFQLSLSIQSEENRTKYGRKISLNNLKF